MKRIKNLTSQCGVYFEHKVEFQGKQFLLLYGYHSSGDYILIPSRHISCELNEIISVNANLFASLTEKLVYIGLEKSLASAIEEYLNAWKGKNRDILEPIHQQHLINIINENLERMN